MNSVLSSRIRQLRKSKGYTQKEFSKQLGTAQTTIANYEQGTRVPDTEKLNKMADLFEVTLDYLLGRDENKVAVKKESEEIEVDISTADNIYLQHLLKGDIKEARNLIMTLHIQGMKIEYIYFNILEKALKEIGTLWEVGCIDVWKEHFISETTLDIMRELKSKEKRKKSKKASIITLNSSAEFHNIGLKMISDILELEGFNVIYLGSNVPTQSLIKAIEFEKPDFVAISVTLQYNMDSAAHMIGAIRSNFGKKCPKIIIGGTAFTNSETVCEATGADYYCASIDDIKAVMDMLKV